MILDKNCVKQGFLGKTGGFWALSLVNQAAVTVKQAILEKILGKFGLFTREKGKNQGSEGQGNSSLRLRM